MADFETPALKPWPEIPPIEIGVRWRTASPMSPRPIYRRKVGFPGELIDNWQQVAIDKMGELVDNSRALRVFPRQLRQVWCLHRQVPLLPRHFGSQKHAGGAPGPVPLGLSTVLHPRRQVCCPAWSARRDLDQEVLDEWYSYFHQCSQCRRCSVYCPYGIDTAEISMAAREIMDTVGVGQKYCNEIIGKAQTIGNNLGLPQRHYWTH